jgi:hypothetical protein
MAAMAWVEVFAGFIVCHLAGDFILQTNRQATRKHAGLGRDPVARRALLSHIGTYTLAFLPVLVWIWDQRGIGWALGTAALIALPHLVQDDGRLIAVWARRVKGLEGPGEMVFVALDQSFHVLALFATALLVGS